jgi:hypothetical protein
MSDSQNADFGKFIPGFDFLQNLAQGASQTVPQIPNLGNWIAPTLNLEELEKRITELKAVHFWLEQNSRALGATVQALEVQKMTLATLKGMNFKLGEMANVPQSKAVKPASTATTAAVDPMQLWGALSQQFQQIAASVMQDTGNKNGTTGTQSGAKKKVKKTSPGTS